MPHGRTPTSVGHIFALSGVIAFIAFLEGMR